MTNFIKSIIYISVCIALCTSCKEEASSTVEYGSSYGSWMLSKAYKDGRVTRTLEGTTFDIDTSQITTNLFGDDITYKYERQGKRIELTENGSQVFSVTKSTADTLVLSMERRRKVYQLLMLRNTDPQK